MHDPCSGRSLDSGLEAVWDGSDLAGAAHLELVSGVVQLHPQDAMVEAMLRGWRAQQAARGLREGTIGRRERLGAPVPGVHQRVPVAVDTAHVDEWSLWLTSEKRLAPSTIRGYQGNLRLFSEFLTDARYGWVAACEKEFGRGPIRCRSAMSGTRSRT